VIAIVAALLVAAPSLDLLDAAGARHTLSGLRGKVVVVNFWATWCEPCKDELPSLERLRAALDGKSVVILGVQAGGSARTAKDTAADLGLRFPLLLDRDQAVMKAWKVSLLPTTFVLGPDGKVKFSQKGEVDWSSPKWRRKIEALLPP